MGSNKKIRDIFTGFGLIIIGALVTIFGGSLVVSELYSRYIAQEGGTPGGFILAVGAFLAFFGLAFLSVGLDYLHKKTVSQKVQKS